VVVPKGQYMVGSWVRRLWKVRCMVAVGAAAWWVVSGLRPVVAVIL
jgi:hypothetical protein